MSTITFVPTQRGGTALIFDGYRYNKVRCNNDKNVTYWRCSKNRNCPGRAVTVDNRVKKTNNKHNHPPEAPLPHHHAHHHNPFLNIAAAAAAQHAAAQMRALHQHNHNQSQHQHNQQLNQHHQHQHQQQLPFHSAHNLILGGAAGVGAGQHHQNQHHQQHLARHQSAAVAAAMAQSHAHHQQQHQHQQLSTLISSQLAAAAAAAAVAASAPASSPHQRLSQQAAESQAGAGPLSVDSLLHHAQHQQQQQQQQQQQLQHLTSQQQHQLLAAAFQQHHLLAAVLQQQQQQQQQQAQQHNHLTAGNNSGLHPVQQHHRQLLTAAAGATAATGDHELKPRDFRSIGAAAASVSSSTAGAQSHTSNGTSTSASTKDITNSCSNPAISANNSADSGKLAASKRPGESAALLNDQTQQARAAPQWPVHVKRESKPMLESGSNSCASSCSPPLSSAGHSRPTSAALLANGTGSDKRLAGDQSSRGEREERSPGFVSPAPSSGGASVGTCASNSAPIEQQQQRRRARLDHRPESGANSGTSDVDIKPQLQQPASFDCSPSRLDEQLDSADLAGRDTSGRAGAGPGQLGVQLDTSSLAGNTNGRSTPDSSRFNAAPFPSHQQLLTPPASATLTAAATVTSPPESALGGQLNLEQLARFNQQIMQQHQNQRHNLPPAFSESVQAQIALLSLLGLTNPMQWNPSLNIEH